MKKGYTIILLVVGLFIIGGIAYFVGADTYLPALTKKGFTVQVIDAVTKDPVSFATVSLKEVIGCDEAVGSVCPEPDPFVSTTNEEGSALFEDALFLEKFTQTSFMITVTAENYEEKVQELPFTFKKKRIVIELIGGDIVVKNKEDAIQIATQYDEVVAWRKSHPTATPLPKTEFSSPYWILEYNDKADCEKYNQKDRDCALVIEIDARDASLKILY